MRKKMQIIYFSKSPPENRNEFFIIKIVKILTITYVKLIFDYKKLLNFD